jgi:hypothetical protein
MVPIVLCASRDVVWRSALASMKWTFAAASPTTCEAVLEGLLSAETAKRWLLVWAFAILLFPLCVERQRYDQMVFAWACFCDRRWRAHVRNRLTHLKPRWLIALSTICGWRAAGR